MRGFCLYHMHEDVIHILAAGFTLFQQFVMVMHKGSKKEVYLGIHGCKQSLTLEKKSAFQRFYE